MTTLKVDPATFARMRPRAEVTVGTRTALEVGSVVTVTEGWGRALTLRVARAATAPEEVTVCYCARRDEAHVYALQRTDAPE